MEEQVKKKGDEKSKIKWEICDKCNGKGYWYEYGHSGETEYYHECDKCHSSGQIKSQS